MDAHRAVRPTSPLPRCVRRRKIVGEGRSCHLAASLPFGLLLVAASSGQTFLLTSPWDCFPLIKFSLKELTNNNLLLETLQVFFSFFCQSFFVNFDWQTFLSIIYERQNEITKSLIHRGLARFVPQKSCQVVVVQLLMQPVFLFRQPLELAAS